MDEDAPQFEGLESASDKEDSDREIPRSPQQDVFEDEEEKVEDTGKGGGGLKRVNSRF